MTALALSACNAKSTTFNKALNIAGDHSSNKTQPQPLDSPKPSASPEAMTSPTVSTPPQPIQSLTPVIPPAQPAPEPAPVAPSSPQPIPAPALPAPVPAPIKPVTPPAPEASPSSSSELSGNFVSLDADLEISASKDFVMHSEALSALSSSPSSQTLCKIERAGTVDTVVTDGPAPAIHFTITSEKFSAAQAGNANDNFCSEVEKSLSAPHAFTAPITSLGKGFFILKLDESSSDGASLTTSPGILSGLFFDRDSNPEINDVFFQTFSGNFTGAYGGFLALLPIPRLTLEIDPTGKLNLVDNECAFSITGLLKASANSGSIFLSAPNDSLTTATISTAASKTYSVYFGRISGGCTQRKQNFTSQLTGAGVKITPASQTGKYNLDFSAVGGSGAKYIIHHN